MKEKISLSVFLLIFSFSTCFSQFIKFDSIYFTETIGAGSHFGIDLEVSKSINSNLIVGANYSFYLRKAQSIPNDFEEGILNNLFFNLNQPIDRVVGIHLTLTKVNKINDNLFLNIKGLAGYSQVRLPEEWVFVGGPFIGDNYIYSYKTYHTTSFGFMSYLEFRPRKFLSIILGSRFIYSPKQTIITGNAGLQLNIIRS
ncbi:MAG: hypothetical protein RLO81_11415 [Fulvivirga sp.]|uniref:hypothetical protein n=1 Tax=Fulvivirga sp. TaxID=1931237 RepID=UPI0032EEC45C